MAQKITRKAAQICMKNMVDQNKFGKTLDKILKQDMGDSPYAVTKKGTPRVEFYGENTIKNVYDETSEDDEDDEDDDETNDEDDETNNDETSEDDDDETNDEDDETNNDETIDEDESENKEDTENKKQILVELFEEYQKIRTDNMAVGANDSCLNEAMTEALYEFKCNTVGEEKNNNADYWLRYLYTNTNKNKKIAKSVANQMYELSLKIETIMNGMRIKYTELEELYEKSL
jgi:cobalamin biosynthesis protein CobT